MEHDMKFDSDELVETLKKHGLLICQYRWETPLEPNERESYLADVKKTIFEVFEKEEAEKIYELVRINAEVLITFILVHALY